MTLTTKASEKYQNFEEKDLLGFFEYTDLSQLEGVWTEHYAALLERANQLLVSQSIDTKIKSRSFMAAIGIANIPVDLAWVIASSIGIKLGILAFTIPALIITLGIGLLCYAFSMHKFKKREEDFLAFSQIAILKIEILDELIRRKTVELQQKVTNFESNVHKKDLGTTNNNINKGPKYALFSSGSVAFLTAFSLIASYYSLVTTSFTSFGLVMASSILAGPIGLTLVCLLAVSIGFYFGYKHYQARVGIAHMKAQKVQLELKITQKHNVFETLNEVNASLPKQDLGKNLASQEVRGRLFNDDEPTFTNKSGILARPGMTHGPDSKKDYCKTNNMSDLVNAGFFNPTRPIPSTSFVSTAVLSTEQALLSRQDASFELTF